MSPAIETAGPAGEGLKELVRLTLPPVPRADGVVVMD